MTTNQQHVCAHPGRDLTIVALCAALASLVAVIVVMTFQGSPLDAFKAGGGVLLAVFVGGLAVLQYLKRTN
ncbi:hypothetical protein ABZ957_18965 [Streptomyces sp. NPDC046316]|uniref:hypothetical protein n=1 Tax=unclassified Streptomyces TaxID=2593676 RepID=UPI0033FA3805